MISTNIEHLLLTAIVGIIAGFINIIAGGGSLLTIPMLIFLGMPANVALGTNRIGILSQNAVAIIRFRRTGRNRSKSLSIDKSSQQDTDLPNFPWKQGLVLGFSASAGAILGSQIAVELNEDILNKIISVVLLLLLIPLFLQKKSDQNHQIQNLGLLIPIFFALGIYGGFIQIGAGLIIMTILSWITRAEFYLINSIKVIVIFLYTIPALIIYILNDLVLFLPGLVLALGSVIGAILGAHISMYGKKGIIQLFLCIAVIAMSIRLFFFSNL